MQVFVNDRHVTDVAAARSTIGELVEALGVHVDPSEVLTAVALDDEVFSAGDDARYARRSTAGVRRLTLTTSTIPALAASLRCDVRHALLSIAGSLELVIDALGRGEAQAAHQTLATALDELRLVLILDDHTVQLGGGAALTSQAELTPLAEDLLAAQNRADRGATRTLIAERLLPLLRDWSASAAAGVEAAAGRLGS
jgi:hypothetical protein